MEESKVKYRQVYETLRAGILNGSYPSNRPLPSLRALVRRYGHSIITVRRAFDELEREGLISRQKGRGTFVTRRGFARRIGLMLPDVAQSEFFSVVASEVSQFAQKRGYSILFGNFSARNPKVRIAQARKFAQDLVREGVSGVIYQPIDRIDNAEEENGSVVRILDEAGIPVVLLDSDYAAAIRRSSHDVVGINNYETGYKLASHLLSAGARRIEFLLPDKSGRCRAQCAMGAEVAVAVAADRLKCVFGTLAAEPDDLRAIRTCMRRDRPDAFICSSDRQAAKLMVTLEKLGFRIPDDVMLAGINDIQIASLMTPGLTTIRQPCAEIARKALETLVARILDPKLPTSEICLNAPLVIRGSTQKRTSGARKEGIGKERKK